MGKHLSCIASLCSLLIISASSKLEAQTKVKTIVAYQVVDYKLWRAVFDGIQDLRKASGEVSSETGTLINDRESVLVFHEWPSFDHFRKYISEPDIAIAMKNGGVKAPPHCMLLQTRGPPLKEKNGVRTFIYQQVTAFDRWRSFFHHTSQKRQKAGELSYEVGTISNNPNIAYIMSEWVSADNFVQHIYSMKRNKVFSAAGALGVPGIIVFAD